MIWKYFKKQAVSSRTGTFLTRDEKIKEGIEFTIRKYGDTLKDLARYDRGEPLKR